METVGSTVSFAVFGMSIMITITANPSSLFSSTLRARAGSSWGTQGTVFGGFMLRYPTQKTTGCTGSSHGKEQFNLTLTFPVRTEGNSVSNLLLKPNLENKRDKQNIFHLTYFVSLN